MMRLLVPVAVAVTGCQHAPPSTRPDSPLGPIVGREELLSTGQPLLLDALRVARPLYFLSRGPTSINAQNISPLVVVMEGMVLPDLEQLRTTRVADVAQVRRLSASETFFRFNRSVSVGALEIVLQKQ